MDPITTTPTTLEPDDAAPAVPWSFEESAPEVVAADQPAVGADGQPVVQPATPPAAPAAVPSGPSAEDRIAALEEQLRAVSSQRDTATNETTLARALVAAQAEQRRQWVAEQQATAALAPPTLTEDEKARIIADPDLLWEKILDVNRRGAVAVLQAIDQRLSKADIMHDLGQPLVDIAATVAENQAREMASQRGIDADTFNSLNEQATQYISAAASTTGQAAQLNYTKMMLNPSARLAAIEHVQRTSQGGVPVTKQRAPTSIGTGESTAARRTATAPKPASVAKMERDLGHAFTPEQLAYAAKRAKEFDNVL